MSQQFISCKRGGRLSWSYLIQPFPHAADAGRAPQRRSIAISSFPMPTPSRYPLSMRICLFNPLYNRLRHTRRSRYDNLPRHTGACPELEVYPEQSQRACPELAEGACPELAEGACPELSRREGIIGFVFPYFQNFGPFLALEVDITLETIPLLRHDAAPPLNIISRLTTIFTTYKKRLMSSWQTLATSPCSKLLDQPSPHAADAEWNEDDGEGD